MASESPLPPSRFRIREAMKEDPLKIKDVFFRSFNAPFWRYFVPPNEHMHQWIHDAFAIGLENPTDRTFVVEDTEADDRVVAFSRWIVPQSDGNLDREWPEVVEKEWDMELTGAFLGGMNENRSILMEKRPHWMLEFLGVDEDYQRQGIGASLVKYGTEQADKEGVECYLNATEESVPYYVKHHGFEESKGIDIPDRPAYGKYHYVSMIRKPR